MGKSCLDVQGNYHPTVTGTYSPTLMTLIRGRKGLVTEVYVQVQLGHMS